MYFEYECPNGCPKHSVSGNVDVNREMYCSYCGALMELKKVYPSLDAKILGDEEQRVEQEKAEQEQNEETEPIFEETERIKFMPIGAETETQKPKVEKVMLNFTAEETQADPELKSGEYALPFNVKLREKRSSIQCDKKDYNCIFHEGKPCCLRLIHGLKPSMQICNCPFEKPVIEETEQQNIEELGE
jgi:tRNA(Glu) U13 pseudouridine synthase TruD